MIYENLKLDYNYDIPETKTECLDVLVDHYKNICKNSKDEGLTFACQLELPENNLPTGKCLS
jgi:hypothetical protein